MYLSNKTWRSQADADLEVSSIAFLVFKGAIHATGEESNQQP